LIVAILRGLLEASAAHLHLSSASLFVQSSLRKRVSSQFYVLPRAQF
jgi:hypothetical protein